MFEDIERVLLDKSQIKEMVAKIGRRISQDYKDKELILIGVLKGGVMFLADLMREISIPLDMDFISVSSYGNSTNSSGVVRIMKDVDMNIAGKHVLIVEDLIDTGLTLNHLKELFATRGPASIKICTILDKPSRRKSNIIIEYNGFEIPDEFVVGYGLDYDGKYRNLPDVCTLKPEVYNK